MFRRTAISSLMFGVVALGMSTSPCHAGPILDWLFGPRVVNYAPYQTAYAPAAYAGGCNTCGTQVMQRTVVNYAPQTCYRTTYARIPVTSYRPVTAVDPCTNCATTVLRPCTTYQWQARRVPIRSYRPIYSTVACNPCGQTAYAPASTGCSSCSTGATGATTQPYYGNGGGSSLNPIPMAPQNAEPADIKPTLDPSQLQNNSGASLQAPVGANDRGLSLGTPVRANEPTPAPVSRLKPIPAPEDDDEFDFNRVPQLLNSNPRDKSAALPNRAWAVTTISWPAPVVEESKDEPAPIEPQPIAPATPRKRIVEVLDDSGWHDLRR